MIGPSPPGVGGDQIADLRAWLHQYGMLARNIPGVPGFQFTPHAVQVDRVRHHGVINQGNAYSLAVFQLYRIRVCELDAIH